MIDDSDNKSDANNINNNNKLIMICDYNNDYDLMITMTILKTMIIMIILIKKQL